MPNLLLVDDHAIIRTGLKMIIENFLPHSKADEAGDGDSAFERIKDDCTQMFTAVPAFGIINAMQMNYIYYHRTIAS
jgi:DNA-binding NarL/FixJ family response regulator